MFVALFHNVRVGFQSSVWRADLHDIVQGHANTRVEYRYPILFEVYRDFYEKRSRQAQQGRILQGIHRILDQFGEDVVAPVVASRIPSM